MSIKYAILGILSCNPLTGYDLKKIIQDSPFMHWSGNNNQIYKSLVELLDEELVTNEVHHQEGSPSKKIYNITKEGMDALREWVLSSPEPPEFKKTFLVQLAWADQLNAEQLSTLLSRYEYEIKMQIVLQQEIKRRGVFSPDRSAKESLLWKMIYENLIASYEQELEWVDNLRIELCSQQEEVSRVNYAVIQKNNKKYIECSSKDTPISTEQHALDLITACMENYTNLVMLHTEALADNFFKLRTGLAGSVLQKLTNYHVKVVVVINDNQKIKGRFKDLLTESNKGNSFRVFSSKAEAESWLLAL